MDLREIEIDRIDSDPDQPRTDWASPEALAALDELKASIQESGVLQPVLVRQGADGNYVLVDGERRWRACKDLGIKSLPAYVRDDMAEADRHAAQLFANLARRNLTQDEIAKSLSELRAAGYKAIDLAERLGKSVGWVSKQVAYVEDPRAKELRDQGLLQSASVFADFKSLPPATQQAVIEEHTKTKTPISKGAMTRIAGSNQYNVIGLLARINQDPGSAKRSAGTFDATPPEDLTDFVAEARASKERATSAEESPMVTMSWAELVAQREAHPLHFEKIAFVWPQGLKHLLPK